MDVRKVLGQCRFAVDLPESLIQEMEQVASPLRLSRGEYFCRAGDSCKGVGFLERGQMRIFKTGPTGREITLYHMEPGKSCLLTLRGALTGEPYPIDALVEQDLEAIVFPLEAFRSWVDKDPAFRRFIFLSMAERITDLMELFDEIAFGRMDRRLAQFLLSTGGADQDGNGVLEMTHDQIAAELGSAREVISRLLKDFERQGALSLGRGKLEFKNRRPLQDLVERG